MADRYGWKRSEREVANALGVKRNPNTGEHRSDIDTPSFSIEHKKRKRLPRLLIAAMDQAFRAAQPGKTPVVVLSEVKQGIKAKRFVVMRWQDWLDWYGRPKE